VATLVEQFNIGHYMQGNIGSYSAGMTKKLSLMLAFIGNPSLIILDEPLITLDKDAFIAISDIVVSAYNDNGTMFLLSSHQDLDTTILQTQRELFVTNHRITF
jgi:ABC-2 type transport system ATP-binding protein